MGQWLRPDTPNTGGPGSIPVWETRSCMPQLRSGVCVWSVTKSSPTICDAMNCSKPDSSTLHYLLHYLKFMSIESVMLSNHVFLCHPLLLLPSVLPSIRVFSDESPLPIRRPKYWSFSFSISPCSVYSGLISFTIDWFDVLAVQGALKSTTK